MTVQAVRPDTPMRRWLPAISTVAAGAGLSVLAFLIGHHGAYMPAVMLILGLVLSGLIGSIVHREHGRRIDIEAAVAERTAELHREIAERHRAEARFHDFAAVGSDWLWETDAAHRFTYVSANVEQNSGRPPAYYLGKRLGDGDAPGIETGADPGQSAEMEGHRPFKDLVSKRRHADGSTWYVRASGKPVFATDGTFLGYRGASTNVTAEVMAQREAEAAHEQLVQTLEIMPAGVMVFDRADRLVLANARIREMFPRAAALFEPGTPREAQLEFAVSQGAIPEARARAAEWIRERMAAFRTAPASMILPIADGRWFQHLGRKTGDGGTISVMVDVSELKRAEQDLRAAKRRSDESLALLDALQAAAPIGFAFVDLAYRIVRVNDAMAATTEFAASEQIGKSIAEVVPALWPQIAPVLARVLETEKPVVNVEMVGEMPAKPGQGRHWLATFYPVRVEGGVTGIGIVAFEVTGQRRAEAQLRQAQKMEAIGNLTGGVAHDFNNLLGVVIGNLDLLVEGEQVSPEALELAGEARDAALRGADLTRQLLAFARQQPLQPRQVELNERITAAAKLLGRLLGESIAISLDLAEAPWPVVIDAAQLESTLANLATNARDAMPGGGSLRIATRNCQLDAAYAEQYPSVTPGDYVLIEVTDTGSGMPPEVLSRVFEPFFTTKPQGRGTGLGLSMVFGFIKQSGGHISVYSEEGLGTTFRLYLPRGDARAVAEEQRVEEPLPRGKDEVVLVVEDNAALRRVAVRQLGELGYRVRDAENGQQAIEALERDPAVDVLFTDVIMPGGMDGRELADLVAARWPAIKALLASGFPGTLGDLDLVRGAKLLNKPYRREELAQALRELIERDRG
jgi:two-component system, cell cycle sensor histidine kinase and response regulator CckA